MYSLMDKFLFKKLIKDMIKPKTKDLFKPKNTKEPDIFYLQ